MIAWVDIKNVPNPRAFKLSRGDGACVVKIQLIERGERVRGGQFNIFVNTVDEADRLLVAVDRARELLVERDEYEHGAVAS